MSLQPYIESLRAKPEHVRRRYAFWGAFGTTMVIFAFWVGSMTSAFNGSGSAVASAVAKAGSPGQSLIAGVGSFFTDIKDLVFGAKKVKFSTVEVRPGEK